MPQQRERARVARLVVTPTRRATLEYGFERLKALMLREDLTTLQGAGMGRPSQILVQVPPTGGIVVTGTAVPL